MQQVELDVLSLVIPFLNRVVDPQKGLAVWQVGSGFPPYDFAQ